MKWNKDINIPNLTQTAFISALKMAISGHKLSRLTSEKRAEVNKNSMIPIYSSLKMQKSNYEIMLNIYLDELNTSPFCLDLEFIRIRRKRELRRVFFAFRFHEPKTAE